MRQLVSIELLTPAPVHSLLTEQSLAYFNVHVQSDQFIFYYDIRASARIEFLTPALNLVERIDRNWILFFKLQVNLILDEFQSFLF
jgi:hypothetical protein